MKDKAQESRSEWLLCQLLYGAQVHLWGGKKKTFQIFKVLGHPS